MQLDVEGLVVRRLASVARAARTGATASATATGTARSDPIALRIAKLRRGSYFSGRLGATAIGGEDRGGGGAGSVRAGHLDIAGAVLKTRVTGRP